MLNVFVLHRIPCNRALSKKTQVPKGGLINTLFGVRGRLIHPKYKYAQNVTDLTKGQITTNSNLYTTASKSALLKFWIYTIYSVSIVSKINHETNIRYPLKFIVINKRKLLNTRRQKSSTNFNIYILSMTTNFF